MTQVLICVAVVAAGWFTADLWDKVRDWQRNRPQEKLRREYDRAAARRLGECDAETFATELRRELRGGQES